MVTATPTNDQRSLDQSNIKIDSRIMQVLQGGQDGQGGHVF